MKLTDVKEVYRKKIKDNNELIAELTGIITRRLGEIEEINKKLRSESNYTKTIALLDDKVYQDATSERFRAELQNLDFDLCLFYLDKTDEL